MIDPVLKQSSDDRTEMRNYPVRNVPEWIQREIEEREEADNRLARRLAVGLSLFTIIALFMFLTAFRDRLPEGW